MNIDDILYDIGKESKKPDEQLVMAVKANARKSSDALTMSSIAITLLTILSSTLFSLILFVLPVSNGFKVIVATLASFALSAFALLIAFNGDFIREQLNFMYK